MNTFAAVPYFFALHADEANMPYSFASKDEGFLEISN